VEMAHYRWVNRYRICFTKSLDNQPITVYTLSYEYVHRPKIS
jgi:hypothetical protein